MGEPIGRGSHNGAVAGHSPRTAAGAARASHRCGTSAFDQLVWPEPEQAQRKTDRPALDG